MPTPRGGYYLNGQRLPSVTTIIKCVEDQSGLVHAAWKLGKEGKDYRSEWKRAAEVGTAVHSLVELWMDDKDLPADPAAAYKLNAEDGEKTKKAFKAFHTWATSTNLKAKHQETNLISEEYKFGGTMDGVFEINGKLALVDWKTSKGTYAGHVVQLAAYGLLVKEHMGNIDGGYYLLRVCKDTGDFHFHHWPELDDGEQRFIHTLKAYQYDKKLAKRLK